MHYSRPHPQIRSIPMAYRGEGLSLGKSGVVPWGRVHKGKQSTQTAKNIRVEYQLIYTFTPGDDANRAGVARSLRAHAGVAAGPQGIECLSGVLTDFCGPRVSICCCLCATPPRPCPTQAQGPSASQARVPLPPLPHLAVHAGPPDI